MNIFRPDQYKLWGWTGENWVIINDDITEVTNETNEGSISVTSNDEIDFTAYQQVVVGTDIRILSLEIFNNGTPAETFQTMLTYRVGVHGVIRTIDEDVAESAQRCFDIELSKPVDINRTYVEVTATVQNDDSTASTVEFTGSDIKTTAGLIRYSYLQTTGSDKVFRLCVVTTDETTSNISLKVYPIFQNFYGTIIPYADVEQISYTFDGHESEVSKPTLTFNPVGPLFSGVMSNYKWDGWGGDATQTYENKHVFVITVQDPTVTIQIEENPTLLLPLNLYLTTPSAVLERTDRDNISSTFTVTLPVDEATINLTWNPLFFTSDEVDGTLSKSSVTWIEQQGNFTIGHDPNGGSSTTNLKFNHPRGKVFDPSIPRFEGIDIQGTDLEGGMCRK